MSCSRRGPAFQVGMGANEQDPNRMGASGWFTMNGWDCDLNFQLANKRNCGGFDLASKSINLDVAAYPDYRRARIEWTNNSGIGNDYFAVQKLNQDGQYDDLELMSAYSENTDMQYFHTYDATPADGDNYYRVKLALRDGTLKYSDAKKVSFTSLSGVNIFPNPADDHVDVDLTNYKGKDVTIYLYDQLGNTKNVNQVNNANSEPFRLNFDNHSSGSYMIRITTPGKRDIVKQVMIQK